MIYTERLLQQGISLRGVCESVADGLATCLSDHYLRAYADVPANPGDLLRGNAARQHADGLLLDPQSV